MSNIVEDGFDAGIRLDELVAADMIALCLTLPFKLAVVGARGGLYRWKSEESGQG